MLRPDRIHELIERVRGIRIDGCRLLVGTSYRGASGPDARVIAASDVALLHGNHVDDPAAIGRMVARIRALPPYRPMPILFNEDDHFGFEQRWNNLSAALQAYASWGFFDPGAAAGGSSARGDYVEGYQLVPVNWGINTPRKRAFFDTVRRITGA